MIKNIPFVSEECGSYSMTTQIYDGHDANFTWLVEIVFPFAGFISLWSKYGQQFLTRGD